MTFWEQFIFWLSRKNKAYTPSTSLIGVDFENSTITTADATSDKLTFPHLGGTAFGSIFYEAGTDADRKAQIYVDPLNSANKGMLYWIQNAAIPDGTGKFKGRIQLGFNNQDLSSLFYRFRILLGAGFEVVKYWPEYNAIYAISEMWVGEPWNNHPNPGRIKLTVSKSAASGKQPLYLSATLLRHDNGVDSVVWSKSSNRELPIAQWIDIEVGYKAGNGPNGRYYLGMKLEGESSYTSLIDETNWMYNPSSPIPVNVNNIQLLKLYARGTLIDFVRDNGQTLACLFDNFDIWQDW